MEIPATDVPATDVPAEVPAVLVVDWGSVIFGSGLEVASSTDGCCWADLNLLIVFINTLRVAAADFEVSADEGCGFSSGNNVRDARFTLSVDEVRVSSLMRE